MDMDARTLRSLIAVCKAAAIDCPFTTVEEFLSLPRVQSLTYLTLTAAIGQKLDGGLAYSMMTDMIIMEGAALREDKKKPQLLN